jgi:hypothetical protein
MSYSIKIVALHINHASAMRLGPMIIHTNYLDTKHENTDLCVAPVHVTCVGVHAGKGFGDVT